MGKKNKKKTIASTRPSVSEGKAEISEEKKKKKLLKIFSKKKAVHKTEVKEENAIAREIARKAEAAAEVKAELQPAHAAKPRKEKKKLSPAQKQKIRGGILVLIGLFALSFIGWFLFGKMFRPQYLAEILPASNTVGVLEINVDGAAGQPKQFYELMAKYPVYRKEGLIKLINLVLPVDFAKEIEPWLGRRAGIALVTADEPGKLERLYFVESRDHSVTLEFLRSRAMQEAKEELVVSDYKGYKTYGYTLSHLFEFTFIGNYLVMAENGQTLDGLLDRLSAQEVRLSDDADYVKVANNLPQGGLMQGYLNMQKLFDAMAGSEVFMAKKGQDFMAFKPFLSVFKNAGVSIFADKDKFAVQTFTALDKDSLQEGEYITYSEKYQGNLLALASEEPVLLSGGHDMSKELKRLEEIFRGGTKTSALIFDGLLEAQKNIYFGSEISLKDDIYPLLTGEYLFTIDNSFEKPQVTLILELQNIGKNLPRFEKVTSAFEKTSGIFSPRVQEVTLPDGTKGQEIIASPEQVERYDEKYGDTGITTLKLGNTGWSIHYAAVGNKIALTTNKDLLKNIIDRSNGKLDAKFTTSNFYGKIVQPLQRTADELTFVKIGALTEVTGLNENETLKPYLLPFANITAAKNYFTDGISTIYLLEII